MEPNTNCTHDGDAMHEYYALIESVWGDFQAEGIVARPGVELFDRAGRRIITKLKCRDFRAG